MEATLEKHTQDQHVRVRVPVDRSAVRVVIRYAGGVRLSPVRQPLLPGDRNADVKFVSARWADGVLALRAYVRDRDHAAIDLITPLRVRAVQGADIEPIAPDRLKADAASQRRKGTSG